MPTEFRMFESGMGGDFATYLGAATGSIYRLDLGKIYYQKISLESLLKPAEMKEGSLRRFPEEITCKICGTVFTAQSIGVDSEEIIDAYEL